MNVRPLATESKGALFMSMEMGSASTSLSGLMSKKKSRAKCRLTAQGHAMLE